MLNSTVLEVLGSAGRFFPKRFSTGASSTTTGDNCGQVRLLMCDQRAPQSITAVDTTENMNKNINPSSGNHERYYICRKL